MEQLLIRLLPYPFSMADALEVLQVLQGLDVEAIAISTLKENEDIMADLNASQMAQGVRADGSEILPSYRPLTVELKSDKPGLAGVTDRVTLYDTGEHYAELYADVKGDQIEYGSRDEKSAALQKKYDKKKGSIYGLTEDSKEELVTGSVGASWKQKIERQTGLKFT